MDIAEFPINSWYAELEFENAAEISDLESKDSYG